MNNKLVHKLAIFLLLVVLIIPNVKMEVQAQEQQAVVNVDSLKVRSGPGLTYDAIGSVQKNEKLTIISKENDWLKVKYKNTSGWVASWYTTEETSDLANKQIVSKVNRLNVRTAPSVSSAVIGQLNEGDKYLTSRSEKEWIEIDFNGQKGWVNNTYVTIVDQTPVETSTPSSTTEKRTFVISVDVLNVRANPDLSSKKIGQVNKGDEFKVLATDHQWIQVELKNGKKGWLYSFYGNFSNAVKSNSSIPASDTITVLYSGTNIRSDKSTNSEVLKRASAGESFAVLETIDDWYKVDLGNGKIGYLASWVVSNTGDSTSQSTVKEGEKKENSKRKKGTLDGVTIVIDPGHGGNDRGTTGALGTDEKDITLKTAELLSSKLQAAGANVRMTRQSDEYVDLRKRVSIGYQVGADAFISLHYDAIDNSSVRGFTTYYMNSYQKELAKHVHDGLGDMISLKDRGTQPGNYLVLRENKQPAILIELGYLSNPTEEQNVTTQRFREQATHGIYNGIIDYFDSQLK
ncbi:N-acetylmuramoyl-L-alanine amidase [Psychrobacillus sp. AK 1817]|uniref:SH3 domain-containing protein n=1 Tax=Psychrobacillus sp. AK 1817 TaxID=2303505 RepID=UPI00124644B7|nr:SH3 domain-containing protein [Psychrobacillus sp. AK 1817]QEY19289.1 N-acetylmuramoyl-L-alanine amidase [Psychrobacillus sp. AK 1817]